MKDQIRSISEEALREIGACRADKDAIEALRIKYLGRKGIITELFKQMGSVSAEERPEVGRLINVLKESFTRALDEKTALLRAVEESESVSMSRCPGCLPRIGRIHPITRDHKRDKRYLYLARLQGSRRPGDRDRAL